MFRRLTGISEQNLAGAPGAGEVAAALLDDLRTARLVVAHTCLYEARLLKTLPRIANAMESSGLVCTAELARRLLPGLSGFGLRAVSGYLGFPVDALRRASAHVEATARIWQALVRMMEESGPVSEEELSAFLLTSPPSSSDRLERLPEGWRENLPDKPGVYRLRDCEGGDLYIGKASSLKKRVPQHFHSTNWRSKDGMTSAICGIDVEICETELEAALLEASLIEEARPACNRALSGPPPAVAWLSRDLARSVPEKRRGFPLGPHQAGGPLSDLKRLCDALAAGEAGLLAEACRWFGSFEQESLASGFEMFRAAHPDCASGSPADLQRLASLIETPEKGEDGEWGEDPEPVKALKALESIVAAAGSAARRTRWYGLLTCSTLRWETAGGTRELVFCRGNVESARWVSPETAWGSHSGGCPGIGTIGPSGLRRLSLLTGEIRSLVRRGRGMTLIPEGDSKALDMDRLRRMLERI